MTQINTIVAPAPKAIIRFMGVKKKEKHRKREGKRESLMNEMLLYLQATVNRSGQARVGNQSTRAHH